ncbi:MAG TPA: twin-arginine translocation signal domain-containing protein [Candidatus Angelobacter sp.]|nr:twin-arginine translocation signal domain-containing protein [Candidatus Angelobacter sp.]
MNRRDLLKALGALPLAGALGGCGRADSRPIPDSDTKAHSLQILLEGAFAVVLQEQSQRLTAFVPLPDPANKDLAHDFYFNDPESAKKPNEKTKGYRFELSGDGIYKYPTPDPYINPGFNDFNAKTEKWRLPPSLVVLDLPFPRSINFSGRPLKVIFGEKALKHTGLMPTNFILEYRVDDASKVRLKCDSSEMHCAPSPHCPPGVLRYYFGVGPETKDPKALQMHAVKFFNFLLATAFPDLARRYELKEIEHSDYEMPGAGGGRTYPSSLETTHDRLLLLPAVLRDSPAPRLLPVASLVDCQSGGIIVSSHNGPNG